MKQYLIARIRSTFARWMISYLVILLIPVVFGTIIYGHAMNNMQQERNDAQQQMLGQARQNFENQIMALYNMAYGVLYSESVGSVAEPEQGEVYSPRQTILLRDIQRQIVNMTTINEGIEAVYLYYPKTDSILSRSVFCPLKNTENFAGEQYHCSLEEVRALAGKRDFYGTLSVVGEENSRLLYSYVRELSLGDASSRILMLVYLKPAAVEELIGIANAVTRLELGDGAVYTVASSKEMASGADGWEKTAEVLELRMESDYYEVSYVSRMPRSIYMKKADQMKGIMVVYLILCLGGGGVAALLIARKNYLPVKELLQIVLGRNSVREETGKNKERDEFQIIRESYQNLKEAYSESEAVRKQTARAERSILLTRLLAGRQAGSVSLQARRWLEQIRFSEYVLIGIEVAGFGEVPAWEMASSQELDLAYFITENVLHELLEPRYNSIEAEAEGMLLSLASPRREEKEPEDWSLGDLRKRLQTMNEFLKKTYQMKLMIQVSQIHSGQEELPDCLQDIQMEQEYRNGVQTGTADILSPADIRYSHGELEYRKNCQKVSRFLEEHKIEKAIKQLSEMMVEASEQKQKQSDISQESGQSETDRMVGQVKKYIEEHYLEHTLTVSLIAEKFDVGITYLSREFKRRNESGLLEYINHLRLEQAKKRIREGHTIKEAAFQVGFFDTQPLIRLFRQVEGMTPSEYRNRMLKKDKEEG